MVQRQAAWQTMPRPKISEIPILYEDEHLLAINKPAGVLVVPDRAGRGGLLRTLRQQMELADEQDLRLVHRIDRDTTGVLLLARSADMQRALSDQFQARRVTKTYLALVTGQPAADSGIIDQRIARSGKPGVMRIDPSGKRAITKWRIKQRFYGYCLLECCPVTGRTHQIRVHLQHIDLPLVVDPLYGGAEALLLSQIKPRYKHSSRKEERPLISRVPLHAASVRFTHPARGELVTIEAPLPKDFAATLKQLEKYAPLRR